MRGPIGYVLNNNNDYFSYKSNFKKGCDKRLSLRNNRNINQTLPNSDNDSWNPQYLLRHNLIINQLNTVDKILIFKFTSMTYLLKT